jgi:hypothetical protein
MTPSPEERAREIVSRALAVDAAVKLGTEYLESLIASTIREAENAIIDRLLKEVGLSPMDDLTALQFRAILEGIKHKD